MNHGLILRPSEPDHWQLDSGKATERFGAGDLNPSGDWEPYAPENELQNDNGLETFNCTNYATIKAIIALAKFLGFEDFPKDASERYTGVLTGTTKEGNEPHHVIEKIRNEFGLIPAEKLPFSEQIDTWEEYYSPNPMDEDLVALGQSLLARYSFGQEWVFPPESKLSPEKKQQKLQEALKRGTVAVSVRAWEKKGAVYTKEPGTRDNHWIWLAKYDKNGYPIVYDHYKPFRKKLAKDYDFTCAKLYFLKKNPTGIPPHQFNYFLFILNALRRLWKR